MSDRINQIRRDRGFALLVFMIVMIGLGAFGISKLLESSVHDNNRLSKEKTREALLNAKEAVLSYAVEYLVENDIGDMGRLPCPDVDSTLNLEGSQDPSCGDVNANSLGLFPFKSFGLGKVEDGNEQCLWYAVSGSYKNSPDLDMVNWDSNGMLTVEDENGNLRHSSDPAKYPIAVLIAPGPALTGQDRTPDGTLPLCGGNHDRDNYLEGGPNLDYSTYTTDDVGSIWSFLDASESASLTNSGMNDQVVYITRKELWDRVEKTKSLDTSVTSSPIKDLTQELGECLVEFSKESFADNKLIFSGKLVLSDYQDRANYKDKGNRLFGRLPQDIHESNIVYGSSMSSTLEENFVASSSGNGYCELKASIDPILWENWKDQFFLVVAKDFSPDSSLSYASKCTPSPGSNCLKINGKENVAAIVFFAKHRTDAQSRDMSLYTDDDSPADQMGVWSQYIDDAANQHPYDGTTATDTYVVNPDDYAVCVIKGATQLSMEEC